MKIPLAWVALVADEPRPSTLGLSGIFAREALYGRGKIQNLSGLNEVGSKGL
jgi:hypothetical protein